MKFSLRTFFLLGMLVTAGLGWVGWQVRAASVQRQAVELVTRLGGSVGYDYERIAQEERRKNPPPPRPAGSASAEVVAAPEPLPVPAWLVALTGKDWWVTVEKVHLYDCTLTSEVVAAISRLPELRLISTRNCDARGVDLSSWGRLKSLYGVFLTESQVDDAQLAFTAKLPKLEYAEFVGCPLGDATVAYLRFAPLRRLNLSGTKVTDAGLEPIANIRSLERLVLEKTAVQGPGLRHLAGLPVLKSLDLSNTAVVVDGLEHLATLPTLTHVELNFTQVNDESVRRLAKITSLDHLAVAETAIVGRTLAELKAAPNLRRLALHHAKLSDDTVGNLSGLPNLEVLDIPANGITDTGLARLVDLPKLTWLNLNRSPITDQGLEQLSRFPALAHVIVFDCPQISLAGASALQRALPQVSVASSAGVLASANP